ncbi:MAG: hypothetical protein IJ111_01805 [Eggerthellaceae bacterium]|nr:hypothetical protein [Eggerthellaceae bacterium]
MKRAASTCNSALSRGARWGACAILAGTLLGGGAVPFPTLSPERAEAADVVYVAAPSEFGSVDSGTEIEQLTKAYDRARAVAVVCDVRMAAYQKRAEVLESQVLVQQERCDNAMREQYKLQQNRIGVVEMLLSSDSLDDFLRQTEYIESISRANVKAISALRDTQKRLEAVRSSLDEAKASSDAVLNVATEALDMARAARAAKQQAGSTGSGVSFDGADWYMTESEFVGVWAPRIDAYLAGSPMAGLGEAFARASWRYCVDPRWSPAISNTESSKGAYCIRPHNAWGWGAADSDPYNLAAEWGSWEEAIDAHVRGLATGYGYTISKAAAEKYCSSPEDWYNNTKSQMELI